MTGGEWVRRSRDIKMASEKQIAANRRNAKRSCGPVTAEGKARSSQNALRHGLSRAVTASLDNVADIEEFVLLLVGEPISPYDAYLARSAGIAQLELSLIDRERRRRFEALLCCTQSSESHGELEALARLHRYESRALSRRKKAFAGLSRRGRLPLFD
jgi:hypothetical protein